MNANWLENLIDELRLDQTSPTALQLLSLPMPKLMAALQEHSDAIYALFKNTIPSNDNFPLLATMVALAPNSKISSEEYFAWLRFHPMCIMYNLQNLILGLNAYFAVKSPNVQIDFLNALIKNPNMRSEFTEYLDYQVIDALKKTAKTARAGTNKALINIFNSAKWAVLKNTPKPDLYEAQNEKLTNAQAVNESMTMDLGKEFNFDLMMAATDVLNHEQLAEFFEQRLPEFRNIATNCDYFLAEVVYQIRAYLKVEDLDYLNTKVLVPHIQQDMSKKLVCPEDTTGDISIVYALCAEYLERLQQNKLLKPQQLTLAQNIVQHYLNTVADIDYIVEGWPVALRALNFTLNAKQQQQLLDATYDAIRPLKTAGVDDGASGILFMYEKPENLVQCPRYKLAATEDASMRNAVQAIVVKAQSLYTGKQVAQNLNCITDVNFMPMYVANTEKAGLRYGNVAANHTWTHQTLMILLGLSLALGLLYKIRHKQSGFIPGHGLRRSARLKEKV